MFNQQGTAQQPQVFLSYLFDSLDNIEFEYNLSSNILIIDSTVSSAFNQRHLQHGFVPPPTSTFNTNATGYI